MRRLGQWGIGIFLSAAQMLLAQEVKGPEGEASDRAEWISAMVRAYAANQGQLEEADPRNRKLFGNAEFLRDIDERHLFLSDRMYSSLVGRAERWLAEAFPSLRPALGTGEIEACASYTANAVFVRGRAGGLYFAAAVPLGAASGNLFQRPMSITFLGKTQLEGTPIALAAIEAERADGRAEALHRCLSQFGDVRVDRIAGVTQTGAVVEVEAEGSLQGRGKEGKLRISATGAVLRLELTQPRDAEPYSANPMAVGVRAGEERYPDWRSPDRNVVVGKPWTPESQPAQKKLE